MNTPEYRRYRVLRRAKGSAADFYCSTSESYWAVSAERAAELSLMNTLLTAPLELFVVSLDDGEGCLFSVEPPAPPQPRIERI